MSELATVLDRAEAPLSNSLVVRPVAGQIGAEIEGVRLSGDLPAPVFTAINQALLKHKVIFFRGQTHLDDAEHEAFGRRFGSLVAHPTRPPRPGTSILELDAGEAGGRADSWHTDVTFVDAYPAVSLLRAVVVPDHGGDTLWANTVAAYQALTPELRGLADQLWAIHSNLYDYGSTRQQVAEHEKTYQDEVFTSTQFETEHPLVHVHPETGERALILGHFLRKFVGHSQVLSTALFNLFQSHVTRPEFTVRWRWSVGDLAIWDNRATQHSAINDYGDQPRVVRRVTVDGVPTVGVDGRRGFTRNRTPRSVSAAA